MHSDFNELLRVVQQGSAPLSTLTDFQKHHPEVAWTEIRYVKTGDSLLHVCARVGRSDFVSHILQHWPPHRVDFPNNDGKTALHEAAQFSQTEVARVLLASGAEVNSLKRADWTPLMLACTRSGSESLKTVRLLLESGAMPELVNKDGWNALHLACRTGDSDLVFLILSVSQNLTATKNGRTCLHIASLHGHVDVTKLLIDFFDNIDILDKCGNSPFHEAICSKNIECVKLLVQNGCNISAKNGAGMTALHMAASEDDLPMIKYIITDLKMDPNIPASSNGITPLHCAARKKKEKAVEQLVSLGANSELRDAYGRTARDYMLL